MAASRNVVTHMVARAALELISRYFKRDRIDALVVKGVATGPLLYRNVGERPISDLDLRVRRNDLTRIVALARRENLRIVRYSRAYQSVIVRIHDFDVDIESCIGAPGLCSLSTDEMFERACFQECGGLGVLTPELHDHVLLLCVNVFKDKIRAASPSAIRDLELITQLENFDAKRFALLVERKHARTIVSIVADWLARERANETWRHIRDEMAPPRQPYASLFRALIRGRPNRWALRVLARVANDDPAERVRALVVLGRWVAERHAARRDTTPAN
ncbi:MAG TPA: nucleotidyltransferase family protein [Polyangiaceae bacterium]|nr:nucleotidyltransferase family protein [Polyangiaceae bacterium]